MTEQINGDSVVGVGLPLNAVRTGGEGAFHDALCWLEAALRCPSFDWDADQRDYAQAALDQSRASLRTHAPQLGDVSVPSEIAAGAQKQDHPSEIAELEQEASLMRARNERLQQERDALLEAASQLLVFVDNLLVGAAIAKAEGTQSKFERSTALYLGKLTRLAHDAIDKTEGRA